MISTLVEKAPLAPFSTLQVGGYTDRLAIVNTAAEMTELCRWATVSHMPWVVIGRGSNTLFPDGLFPYLVIINKMKGISHNHLLWRVEAGHSFSRLAMLTSRRHLGGLEFAAAIPGSVGGAVYMNAGAAGMTTADSLVSIEFLHPDGTVELFDRHQMNFGYRSSPFQKMKGIILAATFQLYHTNDAEERMRHISEQKRAVQPYEFPSLGCIFKNPLNQSAGALIDSCGLKGTQVGGAAVSCKHANFIINMGNARASDIVMLQRLIMEQVYERYAIVLEPEICTFEA